MQHNSSIEHRTLAPYSSDAVVALQNRQSCLWMRLEHALRCNDTGEAWRDLSITACHTGHDRRQTCAYNNDVEADCILRRWHADGVLHARASRINQGGRDGARLLLGKSQAANIQRETRGSQSSAGQQGISGLEPTGNLVPTNQQPPESTSLGGTGQCEQFRWRWACTVPAATAGSNRSSLEKSAASQPLKSIKRCLGTQVSSQG